MVGANPPALPGRRCKKASARLSVRVADELVAIACLEAGADEAQVPAVGLSANRPVPPGIVAVLPRIAHDRELGPLLRWATDDARVVVGNLGLVKAAADRGANVAADWPLNAINAHSVAQLAELGASFVWLSPELSGRQVARVAEDACIDVGLGVYGRQELMVTEHCILMAEGPCEQRCGSCERRAGKRVLRDRKGYEFPVVTDITGRSHVYNSVPLDLTVAVPEIIAAGVSAVRLDLELDELDTAVRQTRRFGGLLERAACGVVPAARDRDSATTSGHYFRGVL